jgi:hypothetical protein
MATLIVLIVVALVGVAAYSYLHANGIGTAGEERLALVLGLAFTLVLDPVSPSEFAAELVGLTTLVLAIGATAHLAASVTQVRRATGSAG